MSIHEGGFTTKEDEETKRKAEEAERMIAEGKVRVNPKNHVVRGGKKRAEDAEDKEVSSALDELDALDAMFKGVLK